MQDLGKLFEWFLSMKNQTLVFITLNACYLNNVK